MQGTAEECFPMSKMLLCWVQPQYALVAREAKGGFAVQPGDRLLDPRGKPHSRYSIFAEYQQQLLLRSTRSVQGRRPEPTSGGLVCRFRFA